jgi:uncharacterized membrane-anchored protein
LAIKTEGFNMKISLHFPLCLLLLLSTTSLFADIQPIKGPTTGKLGDIGEVKVPEGYVFIQQKDMKAFMDQTHNFYSDNDLGVLYSQDEKSGYMALFSFDDVGYIKDADKEKLDADAMWQTMLDNNKEANKERADKGWDAMDLVGWELKPQYNPDNHRLEWAERLKEKGEEFVNYSTKILGRKGVMVVTLVPNSADMTAVLGRFNNDIGGFDFTTGNKYAEWTTGDKVAEYGLAALVVGGAGALAAKSGILGKLWALLLPFFAKAWALVVAGLAVVSRFFKRLFGGGKKGTISGEGDDSQQPPTVIK